MSAAAETAPPEPATIFWHGLRLHQVPTQRDEVARWETSQFGAGQRCWLSKSSVGQYTAIFHEGTAAYGWDPDETLAKACFKAYQSACYDADRLLARLQGLSDD